MTKSIFIFIVSLLLIFPVVSIFGQIPMEIQLFYCVPFILLFGIPHGAIDNILYLRDKKMGNAQFIAIYLFFVGLNVIFWLISPKLAFIFFLLLSAYHFGQSQFSHYFNNQNFKTNILNFSWGFVVMLALIYFNFSELYNIVNTHSDFAVFESLYNQLMISYLFIGGLTFHVLYKLVFYFRGIFTLETLSMEFLVLGLILLAFFLMPFLIGFSFYFVILHSFKVMREEFKFLKKEGIIETNMEFIQKISPFTAFSILGILALFSLIYLEFIPFSYGYCLLIIISSITLPHAFVMDRFYGIFYGKPIN